MLLTGCNALVWSTFLFGCGVTVVPGVAAPAPITISPSTVTLGAGETQQFSLGGFSTADPEVQWSVSPSGAGTISPQGLYTAPAALVASETVTVSAQSPQMQTGTATVALLEALHPSVVLTVAADPPFLVGTSQEFAATVTNGDGTPLQNENVTFTVSGVNRTSIVETTNSKGLARFSYESSQAGQDVIIATASDGSAEASSNSISAIWIEPLNSISIKSVTGRFFLSDGSGAFDTLPTATPVFTQMFPTITFNPPPGSNIQQFF